MISIINDNNFFLKKDTIDLIKIRRKLGEGIQIKNADFTFSSYKNIVFLVQAAEYSYFSVFFLD